MPVRPRPSPSGAVRLEGALCRVLIELGIPRIADAGAVPERGRYHLPVIQPDLVLTEEQVASIWNTPDGSTGQDDDVGVQDDRVRDGLRSDSGWRRLRIRWPDQSVRRDWSWRVEPQRSPSKACSPRHGGGCLEGRTCGSPAR